MMKDSWALLALILLFGTNYIQASIELKPSVNACPTQHIGPTMCPEPSLFSYYTCCGDFNASCCFHLQNWAAILLGTLGAIIAGFVLLRVIQYCRKS